MVRTPLKRALRAFIQRVSSLLNPVEDVPAHRLAPNLRVAKLPTHEHPLTVITMNLWHDWPRYRRLPERLERFARLVEQEGAQLVLLQESLRNNGFEAHTWLADRLGMQAIYHRANGNRAGIGFEEGVAVLSALPVLSKRVETLQPASEPFVRRVALGVEIELGCSTCWAFSTHLGLLPARNAMQIEHLLAWVSEVSGDRPALIGGDFNADESAEQMRKISQEWIDTFRWLHPEKEVSSHTLRWPWGSPLQSRRLDYLFLAPQVAPWRILEASYLEYSHEPYSDHKAILTRLEPCSQN